jgi:glucose-1-phosphate adenylyltransferase
MGVDIDYIVKQGSIVSGGLFILIVLSPGVRVHIYCELEGSILLTNAQVGRYSRIRRAIIDAGVQIPESSVIGFDLEQDRRNGHFVTDTGIVVVSNHRE